MKDSQFVIVPNNEGRVCDAVIRALEGMDPRDTHGCPASRQGGVRSARRPPPETRRAGLRDRAHPDRILRIPNRNRHRREPDRQACQEEHPDLSPGPAYYELQFRIDVSLPEEGTGVPAP